MLAQPQPHERWLEREAEAVVDVSARAALQQSVRSAKRLRSRVLIRAGFSDDETEIDEPLRAVSECGAEELTGLIAALGVAFHADEVRRRASGAAYKPLFERYGRANVSKGLQVAGALPRDRREAEKESAVDAGGSRFPSRALLALIDDLGAGASGAADRCGTEAELGGRDLDEFIWRDGVACLAAYGLKRSRQAMCLVMLRLPPEQFAGAMLRERHLSVAEVGLPILAGGHASPPLLESDDDVQ